MAAPVSLRGPRGVGAALGWSGCGGTSRNQASKKKTQIVNRLMLGAALPVGMVATTYQEHQRRQPQQEKGNRGCSNRSNNLETAVLSSRRHSNHRLLILLLCGWMETKLLPVPPLVMTTTRRTRARKAMTRSNRRTRTVAVAKVRWRRLLLWPEAPWRGRTFISVGHRHR